MTIGDRQNPVKRFPPSTIVTSLKPSVNHESILYERIYCARRHGNPDQGDAVRSARRSHFNFRHEGQSVPALVRRVCPCPGRGTTPARPSPHPVRHRDSWTIRNRLLKIGALNGGPTPFIPQRPPLPGAHGADLSLPERVRACLPQARSPGRLIRGKPAQTHGLVEATAKDGLILSSQSEKPSTGRSKTAKEETRRCYLPTTVVSTQNQTIKVAEIPVL